MHRSALWPAAGACLLAASLSLLAPWAPAYDPWAWLVWGREVGGLALNTTAGPAWKPLPVAVTTLLSPLGEAAPAAWLVLARAAGLMAVVLAACLAARLVPGRGSPVAAGAAALAAVGVNGYAYGVASGHSEGILLALGLLAVLRGLDGRPGSAFALGSLAALVRPEAFAFVAAYALHLWRGSPQLRPVLALGLTGVPALWVMPELWGSGELLRSSQRAQVPNPGAPALAARPAFEVADRFAGMMLAPAAVAAVAAGVVAALRRERLVLAAAAAVGTWVVIVAGMAELGFSGEERYMLPAAVLAAVPAGAGVGWAFRWLAGRSTTAAATLAGAAGVAGWLAVIASVGTDVHRRLAWDARLRQDLAAAVRRAGGPAAVRSCGRLYAGRYRFPLAAWHLRVPIADLELEPRGPGVILRSRLLAGAPPEPAVPAGFRRVAVSPTWDVWKAC